MPPDTHGTLYYGDNLTILREHIRDASIDLVYLDPPFKSDQDYNVLFAEQNGSRSAAQVAAFEDTWRWDASAAETYETTVEQGGTAANALRAFRTFLGQSDMMAYLAMMAPRLLELKRVLKPAGSLYLHCDPTASHYLKMLLDAIFGPANFRNEIIWQRAAPRGHAFTRFPTTHDVLLAYGGGGDVVWNAPRLPHREEYLASHYNHVEPETGRRYRLDNCLNPNRNRPNLTYEWHGHTRVWRWTRERMQQYHDEGRLVYSSSGMPQYKRYLDEMQGTPATSVWTDIPPINSQAQERLGYPTQKPEALLQRILAASSDPGDVVLDPFCGCGTTVAAAQALGRNWIGIDITHLAINLIKYRLRDAFHNQARYEVVGEPRDLAGARLLASENPHQFEWWALGLAGARPAEQRRGADRGIDGRLLFHDEANAETKQILFSVKGGQHVGVRDVRDLLAVVTRERAQIGVLLTLERPTRPMLTEATGAGFYESPGWRERYPRLQILTVEQLLAGTRVQCPPIRQTSVTFRRAPTTRTRRAPAARLPGIDE